MIIIKKLEKKKSKKQTITKDCENLIIAGV